MTPSQQPTLRYTFAAPLKSQGFTNPCRFGPTTHPFQSTGVLTKRSFANSSPEIVESVLRGIVDSMAFIAQPENKPAVLKSLAKGLRLPNVEQAVEGYESLPMLYDRRIYPRVDGVLTSSGFLEQPTKKSAG